MWTKATSSTSYIDKFSCPFALMKKGTMPGPNNSQDKVGHVSKGYQRNQEPDSRTYHLQCTLKRLACSAPWTMKRSRWYTLLALAAGSYIRGNPDTIVQTWILLEREAHNMIFLELWWNVDGKILRWMQVVPLFQSWLKWHTSTLQQHPNVSKGVVEQ